MLSSQRDSQSPYPESLAGWLELDYHRRARPLRRWRKWVTAAFVCVSLLYVVYSVLPANHTSHQAAPVATAHALFNVSCDRCHTESFQPLARLVQGDSVRSVPNHACLACHDGARHKMNVDVQECAGCHREHRGKPDLARVADGHCTNCHRDLAATHPGTKVLNVSAFAGDHPEFGILRRGEPDQARLRFNHAVHLQLDLESLRAAGAPGVDDFGKKLDCVSCHQPDAERRYMKPIKYEDHCKKCHALTVQIVGDFKDGAVRQAVDEFRRTPAPHKTPTEVRAILRERLLEFIQRQPAAARAPIAPEPKQPIPGRGPKPVAEEQATWAENRLGEAEKLLFVDRQLTAAERMLHGAGYACNHCHYEKTYAAKRPNGLPEYFQTKIPDRWLTQSAFNHDSHRMLSCLACHAQAAQSTSTRDVLLPGIASCRECHQPKGGARADCAECHRYHERGLERSMNGQHPTIRDALQR